MISTQPKAWRAAASSNNTEGDHLTRITMKLGMDELMMLSTLASDQLFRREFIDPKMPGYKPNPPELRLGKKLVERLRLTADRARRIARPRKNGGAASMNSLHGDRASSYV